MNLLAMAYPFQDIKISDAQHLYYGLGAFGILASGGMVVLKGIWNMSKHATEVITTLRLVQADVKEVKVDVNAVKTNHLPHVYDRLGRIEGAIFSDRGAPYGHVGGDYEHQSEG